MRAVWVRWLRASTSKTGEKALKFTKTGKLAIYMGETNRIGVAFEIPGLGIDTPAMVSIKESYQPPE